MVGAPRLRLAGISGPARVGGRDGPHRWKVKIIVPLGCVSATRPAVPAGAPSRRWVEVHNFMIIGGLHPCAGGSATEGPARQLHSRPGRRSERVETGPGSLGNLLDLPAGEEASKGLIWDFRVRSPGGYTVNV